MKKIRAAIYARVSTSDQFCEQQLTDLRGYLAARGWMPAGEYVDDAVSGTKTKRPAMERLLTAARKRQVDAIVCVKIDRWGRSMPHFVQTVQELKSLGVRFIAVSQGIDTDESNPASKLMMNMLAAFAEFERELIVERTMAGLQRARAHGRIGGRPKLIVDRKLAKEMRAAGASLSAIAVALGISKTSAARLARLTS